MSIVSKSCLEVSEAARAYESRWTIAALRRVDPELHARFEEQRRLWDEAVVTRDNHELREQTEGLIRGWHAITKRMEESGEPDDAYMLGWCPRTGLRVAIGQQTAAQDRVREVHGEKVCWVTPDEVATMLSSMEGLKSIKQVFPGAELIDLYPSEPKVAA